MSKEFEDNYSKLYTLYPWLSISTTVKEYINPTYYDSILKDYTFDMKSDTQRFQDWLMTYKKENNLLILELGCGSGRVTRFILEDKKLNWQKLYLIDLSNQMLTFCRNKFSKISNITYINSDCISFLKSTRRIYDLVYSLWSFSHSVHQHLSLLGMENGVPFVRNIINKFITKNLTKNSTFFLLHFDSMSDEQKILIKQWKKVYPIFADTKSQSPSKLLIDAELNKLKNNNIIDFTLEHYIGSEIVYSSEEEALEYFMNFHMETYFNRSPLLPQVISELKEYFSKFINSEGLISIKPGCFIYQIKRK